MKSTFVAPSVRSGHTALHRLKLDVHMSAKMIAANARKTPLVYEVYLVLGITSHVTRKSRTDAVEQLYLYLSDGPAGIVPSTLTSRTIAED